MYPSFTLHKGGAFMLCESIDDISLQEIETKRAEYPVEGPIQAPPPEVQEEARKIADGKSDDDDDPVDKVISKLGEVYTKNITPLFTMDYGYESPDDAIMKLNQISGTANKAVETLHKRIRKLIAQVGNYDQYAPIYRAEFDAHLGYFMKNKTKVAQQGIGEYHYTYKIFPPLSEPWVNREIVLTFAAKPELFDMMHFSHTLQKCQFSDTFDGFMDFMQCIFNDPARRMRLESSDGASISFVGMLDSARTAPWYSGEQKCFDSYEAYAMRFIDTMAAVLRKICRECYDLECMAVDGTLTVDVFRNRVTPILYAVTNLYGLGTFVCMDGANQARRMIARIRALKEYTSLLLTTLKTV